MTENPFETIDLDAEDFFSAGDDAELFRFENIGDKITGTLLDIEKKAGKYRADEPFPWLTLQTEEGIRKVAASSWDMQRKLLAEIKKHGGKIQLGATISIEYSDDKTLGNGNVAKEYTVTYEPPAGA